MTTIDKIKQQINLADYARSCGIKLTKHGKNDLKGLCPFHDDKKPSLIITPKKGLFHCPACGAGGSVIDFTAKIKKISIKDAIKELSENHQIPSKDVKEAYHDPNGNVKGNNQKEGSNDQPSAQKTPLAVEREAELLERVISFYEKTFAGDTVTDEKESPTSEGKYYLELRGITDAGLFTKHRIGYANGSLLKALPKDGPILEELETLGILVKMKNGQYIERFRYCVVFPVLDVEGNITTLYARSCETSTNRNHLYLPNRPTGLFNVGIIKTYPEIVLVESCIDALSLEMAGVNNVVSIQSTNGLSDADTKLFKEYDVSKLVCLFDGDKPGQDASIRLIKTLSEHFKVANIALPKDMDPNSYLQEFESEKLLSLFLSAEALAKEEAAPAEPENNACGGSPQENLIRENPCSFVVEKDKNTLVFGLRKYEIIGLEKKPRNLKATIRVEKAGKLHVDTIDFYSSRQRRQLSQDICNAFEELPDTINADIDKLLKACESQKFEGRKVETSKENEKPTITAEETKEAEAFGRSPNLTELVLADYEKCGLIGEESNKLLCYLAMTSRKMQEPLSVLILSSSGAGKTALQDAALEFCPPEELLKLTSLSAKALFYMEQTSLKHKVLAIEEGAGAEDATYAIRNLISSNGLTSEVAMRDPQTGKLTTMSNKVEGPVSVFCTTTNPEVDPETKSRFLVTGIDESREQTRRILDFQKQRHSLNGLQINLEKEKVQALHKNFQRLLKPLAIVNPHIDQLSYSDDRLQGRRAQPQYLNIINTVAFLRQMSKEVKVCEHTTTKKNKNNTPPDAIRFIEVDEIDIEIGNKLAVEILGKTLDELSIPARDLLELIDKMLSARIANIDKREGKQNGTFKRDLTFTRRELREFSGWTNTRLHNHIKELVSMEYIVMDSGRINSIQTYKMLFNGKTDEIFRQKK